MAIIMKYVVVCTYVIMGAIIPLHKVENGRYNMAPTSVDNGLVEMGNKKCNLLSTDKSQLWLCILASNSVFSVLQ